MEQAQSISSKLTLVFLVLTGVYAQAVFSEEYKVDPGHSSAQFSAGHLGFSLLIGRFNKVEGTFSIDAKKPDTGKAAITIDAASIDSNHEKRDKHLRSPDFLNAKQFPKITFESTEFKGNRKGGTLKGKMTLKGVTRPVSFTIKQIGEGKDPWGGYRNGYRATGKIKRSDFGMKFSLPKVRDELVLEINIEGVRKK